MFFDNLPTGFGKSLLYQALPLVFDLRGLSFISAWGGGIGKIVGGGGFVILERYLGWLSHIEKPFEGGLFETLHRLSNFLLLTSKVNEAKVQFFYFDTILANHICLYSLLVI